MSETPRLSDPLPLPCGVTLPNRIAKSAMSELLADRATGEPSDGLVRLYDRWATSGAGMLITGNVMVDGGAREAVGNVIVEDDRFLPQLSRWAETAQAGGAHLWMQISHAGRQTPKRATRQPVAPSAVPMKGFLGSFRAPRALDAAEIEDIVAAYARTARVAMRAGFRGVQIHGAHGYLISQFLSPHTNRRDDAWGGDAVRRRRFALEVVRAVRAAVGPDFPVGIKLNSADFQRGGFSEDESMAVVEALGQEGIDLLEISGGNYESPAMFATSASTRAREAYFLDYAQKVRAVATMPLLLTGGLRTAAGMTGALASGAVDMVGLARPMTVEPDLPARILAGTAEAAQTPSPRVGIKLFDTLLQGAWFGAQLRRMARGLDPDPRLGKLRALVGTYFKSYAFNPLQLGGGKRDRKRLASEAR